MIRRSYDRQDKKNTISNQKRERRRENDKVKWDEISLIKNSFSYYVGVAPAVFQTLRAFPLKTKKKEKGKENGVRKRSYKKKAFAGAGRGR